MHLRSFSETKNADAHVIVFNDVVITDFMISKILLEVAFAKSEVNDLKKLEICDYFSIFRLVATVYENVDTFFDIFGNERFWTLDDAL